MSDAKKVQRSFRLSARTLELLDAAAAESPESRNALADRLLGEGARLEGHPLIRFRQGAAGRRRPLVVGTRLYVHQIVATFRAEGGDLGAAAAYLAVNPQMVQAALDYYGDFTSEVEADLAEDQRRAAAERARWERQQRVLR